MKKTLIATFTFAALGSLGGYARDKSLVDKIEWQEKQINDLMVDKKDKASAPALAFNGCECFFSAKTDSTDGLSFSFNNTLEWNDVKTVTYKKEVDGYNFQLKIDNKDIKRNSFSMDLHTSDEKKIKGIADTFKAAIKECFGNN
jgi:hypothetical protein